MLASNTEPSETVITWLTDEAASSLVEYGTTTSYGSTSTLSSTPLTSHSRTLSNLNPDTTYHYRVISEDVAGNTATSGNFTFTTTSVPDTIPPQLSNISKNSLSDTAATITWNTDEAASSLVEYGTSQSYGDASGLGSTLVTTHSRRLSNLSSDTTYHYRVISQDAAGNTSTSINFSFTTTAAPDTSPPLLSEMSADNITDTLAVITWRSNEPASSQIEYGTDTSYGNNTLLSSTLVTEHQLTLSDLLPALDYHYRVISKDAAGNTTTSDDFTFTTADTPDTTAPDLLNINVSNIAATTARITWSTNESSTGRVAFGETEAYGQSTPLNQSLSVNHEFILEELLPGIAYHYRVESMDATGNRTQSENQSFTTAQTSPKDTSPSETTAVDGGGGGCGIVFPSDGGSPPGPGDAAGMMTMMGLMLLILIKKTFKTARMATVSN